MWYNSSNARLKRDLIRRRCCEYLIVNIYKIGNMGQSQHIPFKIFVLKMLPKATGSRLACCFFLKVILVFNDVIELNFVANSLK